MSEKAGRGNLLLGGERPCFEAHVGDVLRRTESISIAPHPVACFDLYEKR
jgi:hypothetical protein